MKRPIVPKYSTLKTTIWEVGSRKADMPKPLAFLRIAEECADSAHRARVLRVYRRLEECAVGCRICEHLGQSVAPLRVPLEVFVERVEYLAEHVLVVAERWIARVFQEESRRLSV